MTATSQRAFVVDACTIIAGNYLAAARVLADSFFTHHPDGSFTVLVVDDESGSLPRASDLDSSLAPACQRIVWWRLADLGLDTAEIHRLAAIYDVTELCTSVKPLFLQALMRARGSAVVYLDPDIRVFGSLAYVPQLALEHGLVLTPHMTRPLPDDGLGIDALFVLAAGVYNLGFVAASPAAEPCLAWWWQQTRRRALNDVQRQMFTDQRWADYLPSLFSPHLLKDPGYNAAYWNLHERPLARLHGRLYARNAPLRFFHFSGFDPGAPWLLSRHQGARPRILLSEHPVLADLCEEYAAALDRAGHAASSQRRYGWDVTADGVDLSRRIRRLHWSALMAAERGEGPEPPDPFDAAAPGAFTAWLNAPDEQGPRRWSRYLAAIYRERPDVRAHMPDIDGAHAPALAHWLRTDGVVQEGIPPALVPPAPAAGASPTAAPAQGLNIVGYFRAELGVGEAARLLASAVGATGSAYTIAAHEAPHSRQQHPFDAHGAAGRPTFDVNLLCMNADATPTFVRDAGPDFFAGRHTIGYWFWEVDPLPPSMHAAFDHIDEVWTATEYVADIVRTAARGRVPIFTVPLPLVGGSTPSNCSREQLGLPADRFVFLFVFDFLSEMDRKNPLGLIEAFCGAFAPGEGPVLVLKSINGHARIPDLERLRRAAAHRSDIVIRDGYVSAGDKHGLIAACDCYVSLHRAEGLGLTLAEAMELGRPAIATGYSGNRHFMTDENSFLVDYRLTRVAADCGPYPADARWAEANLSHAAQLMRTVYEQPAEAARRARRGQADLRLHHSVAASASAISGRLAEIRRARARAPLRAGVGASGGGVDASAGAGASAAFRAAMPHLRQLGEPRMSQDPRPWSWLRHAAQRAMFRFIRPYTYQQRQFQEALIGAVQESFERIGAPIAPPPAAPPTAPLAAPTGTQPPAAPQPAAPSGAGETRRRLRASLLILLCCLVVYNANGRAISAGDAFTARYQPFALWKAHTIFLDPIETLTSQGREPPTNWQTPPPGAAYWIVPVRGGHLASLYPVVLPLLVAPLYAPAVAYISLRGWTDARIDVVARIMEKLTASLLAALSASLLYLVLRRRTRTSIALLLTAAYAFGTTTWVISSQALWQHGMGQLLVVGAMLLLTAPCTTPAAVGVGLLCGLMTGNRAPDAVLAGALGLYALFWAGRRAPLVIAAAVAPVLLVLFYNLNVIGALGGSYELVGHADFFRHDMRAGLAGLLFSPTRGLFVFSPFLLFVLLAWRYPIRDRAERGLTLAMGLGVGAQVLLYAFTDWRGGISWGPRFMTDLLPLLIWMLVPVVEGLGRRSRACFVAAVGVSMAIESVGAFAYTGVTDVPIYEVASGPDHLRAAWEWKNAPFIASIQRGFAPAELTQPMRGAVDAIEVDGRATDTIAAGQDVVATGWALAGRATPLQVGITIDGKEVETTAVRTFFERPDVSRAFPGAGPSGWTIPLKTAGLAPGPHRLSLYLWASEKGEAYFLARRTLTVQAAGAWETAAARIRDDQQPPGYWLTPFTDTPQYRQPHDEMNTFLTSLLVDLVDPLPTAAGLQDSVQRARRHLTAQIEPGGLVRYHGLPDAPGIGTLGCAITPDADNTALVWRIAPAPDRQRLSSALATLDGYRTADGLYRTWLAPRSAYQCLDPGTDPNPADIGIQMHVLQLLLTDAPRAGRALCQALGRRVDDDRIWVYYRRSPIVPILRAADLERAGCALSLPASRTRAAVPGQAIWVSVATLVAGASRPGAPPPDARQAAALLDELARDDFAMVRETPPLLYHNDLTASVPRYYWSVDVGYALWLRLAHEAGLVARST